MAFRLSSLAFLLLSLVTVLQPSAQAASPISYYVAPTGSDQNNGSLAAPFQTLQRARDAVRQVNGTMNADITVYLRGGVYELSEPFNLSPADSGQNNYNVIYRAYPGETPIISGGTQVTGWKLYDETVGSYRAFVGTARQSRQLYVNERRAIRARTPDNSMSWTKTDTGYVAADTSISTWKNPKDLEFVYRREWANQRCGVADVQGAVITMQQPCYQNAQSLELTAITNPLWIENALELLDSPGEWYLDRLAGYVYYKPLTGENLAKAQVVLPRLEALISAQGTADNPIHNLQFQGLMFAFATWLRPNDPSGFAEVQANYTMVGPNQSFDTSSWVRTPAAVTFSHARAIKFQGNTFTHLGLAGLAILDGSQDNFVLGNEFSDISGIGIQLGGITEADRYPPTASDSVSNNIISNNSIHTIGVEFNGAPGIFVGYTRNTGILYNDLEDLPYTAISMGWGWATPNTGPVNGDPALLTSTTNSIQYNRIQNYMLRLQDGGGIYTLGGESGSIIANNIITNQFKGKSAIYLDEGSHHVQVSNNVIASVPEWLLMWTSSIHDNVIQNNYTDTPVQFDAGLNNQIQNTVVVNNGVWPPAAEYVLRNAGVKPAYLLRPKSAPGINLALKGSPISSSDYSSEFVANRANDGSSGTGWSPLGEDKTAWWAIDLKRAYALAQIEVVTRPDIDQSETRRNFVILASNTPDFANYKVLGGVGEFTLPYQSTWTLDIADHLPYRYIMIRKTQPEYFFLSEVKILQFNP